MRIPAAEAFGVPPALIEAWRSAYGEELLPVQEHALRVGVCSGESVVVVAPTGAGKTLVGEMAAAAAALEGRKVLYTVPTRALADEKYECFRATYEPLGLRVCVSSRDRRSDDARVRRGEFDLLVTVNEKLRALLATNAELVRAAGLLVADEVQTIADPTRGWCLELLLTELRAMTGAAQVVALTAAVPHVERLAKWLDATLITEEQRPVELRRGVLCSGELRYLEHNSGMEGREKVQELGAVDELDWQSVAVAAAARWMADGEPTLLFVRDRRTAAQMALALSAQDAGPRADEAQERLGECETTLGQAELLEALEGAAAFHHAGMSRAERGVALEAFCRGEVLGLVATSTLALGVNLPAQNVIVDAWRWHSDNRGRTVCRELDRREFDNMAGRGGRPRTSGVDPDAFGRGVLVAVKPLQAEAYWRQLICPQDEEEAEQVERVLEEGMAVHLAGIGARQGGVSVPEVYAQTRLGRSGSRERREARAETLQALAAQCADRELLERGPESSSWQPTKLGEICAAKGISVETVQWFRQWADAGRDDPLSPLELLVVAALSEDAAVALSLPARQADDVDRRTSAETVADYVGDEVSERLACTLDQTEPVTRVLRALRATAAAAWWIGPAEAVEVEEATQLSAGTVAEVGETLAWLVAALAAVGAEMGWGREQTADAVRLAERLGAGAPADAVGLVPLSREGLERGHLRQLVAAGYTEATEVLALEQDELSELLPAGVAARLRGPHVVAAGADVGEETEPDEEVEGEEAEAPVTLAFPSDRPDIVTVCGHGVRFPRMQRMFLAALAEQAERGVAYRALGRLLWGTAEADVIDPRERLQAVAAKARRGLQPALPEGSSAADLVRNVQMHGYVLQLPLAAVSGATEALAGG